MFRPGEGRAGIVEAVDLVFDFDVLLFGEAKNTHPCCLFTRFVFCFYLYKHKNKKTCARAHTYYAEAENGTLKAEMVP